MQFFAARKAITKKVNTDEKIQRKQYKEENTKRSKYKKLKGSAKQFCKFGQSFRRPHPHSGGVRGPNSKLIAPEGANLKSNSKITQNKTRKII